MHRSPRGAALAALALLSLAACKERPRASPPAIDDGGPAAPATGPRVVAPADGPIDGHGDPLPRGAIARLGSLRYLDRRLDSMVFAAGGKELVSSSVKGYAIWDAASGARLATLEQDAPGRALAASPGGRVIATAIEGRGEAQLWDLAGRRALGKIHPGREVDELCFADEDTVVTGSDGLVAVWQVGDGSERRRVAQDSTDLSALGCARDVVAWGDDGGAVWFVELGGQAEPVQLGQVGARITSIAPSLDGSQIAAAVADGTIRIWRRARPAQPVVIQAHDRQVTSVAWAGDTLWSAGGDAWLRSWKADGTLGLEIEAIAGLSVQFLTLAPDGKRAATWALNRGAKGSEAGRFWTWDLGRGDPAPEPDRHGAALTAIALSPDGKLVATAGEDQAVRMWTAADGKLAGVLTSHEGVVNALAFDRTGATLYSAGADAYLYGWRWQLDQVDKIVGPIGGEVNAIALAGDRLITGDEVGRVWSWELGSKAKLQAHDRRTYASITGVALSPDGKLLAMTGSERIILIVNLESGAEVARLEPDVVSSFAVAFAPDGKLLASAGDDGRVRLWDTASWTQARALEGHDGSVRCLGFSADGARLASGGSDATARVWQVADGKNLETFTGHGGAVTGVSLSPDGTILATASQDRTGLLWRIP